MRYKYASLSRAEPVEVRMRFLFVGMPCVVQARHLSHKEGKKKRPGRATQDQASHLRSPSSVPFL